MKTKQTFASLVDEFQLHYDLASVFDDFLTMSIATLGRNPLAGLSYDESLYLQTIGKYKNDSLRFNFPKMLGCLTLEMTERMQANEGNDILGEFYESRLAKPGLSQFFTPYPICRFMARSAIGEAEKNFPERELHILDPACGSGRLIMVLAKESKNRHYYYGIDVDLTCVKMTALNLFLSGIFSSEVMCADTLISREFKGSYIISLVPFGIFRIEDKEKSFLWHMVNGKSKDGNSSESSKRQSSEE